MLSIYAIKNAASARSYFEHDNYYSKDASTQSWWGHGVEKIQLNGEVSLDVFETLLTGALPNGDQLGRKTKDGVVHRPGYDLTFSAPKSVSILAELGKDQRVTAAHDKAVRTALAYLQNHASQTRAKQDNNIVFEQTDNLTAALFRHGTARAIDNNTAPDPDLHTHCVVINAVQRQDGKWRSLSSEAIFANKMCAGMVYRATLALELKNLGFAIEQTHADGRFEIKGMPDQVIKHFSKRRQQIEQELTRQSRQTAKEAEIITRDTRVSKDASHDSYVIQRSWHAQAAHLEFSVEDFIAKHKIIAIKDINSCQQQTERSLSYAIEHCQERCSVFTYQQLVRFALADGLGIIDVSQVEAAIKKAVDDGQLVTAGFECFTTKEMLRLEQETIAQMHLGQGKVNPISSIEQIDLVCEGKSYTAGQRAAITLTVSQTDRVLGVQGVAGAGKTTMMRAAKSLATAAGYQVIGLSPTAAAAQQLAQQGGIKADTVAAHLLKVSQLDHPASSAVIGLYPKRLIIVDEASMLSTRQMHALVHSLEQEDPQTRLLLVGDHKQLTAIEAGTPFRQLMDNGMAMAIMDESLRHKDKNLKSAVKHTLDTQIDLAFAKIGDNIIAIDDKQERLKQIAEHYVNLSPAERAQTLVLAPVNNDRIALNKLIRHGLKSNGALTGEASSCSVLINRGLTGAQSTVVYSYQLGDVVRFNKDITSLNIKAGQYLTVCGIDYDNQSIKLQNEAAKVINWKPGHDAVNKPLNQQKIVEVYREESRELMIGDCIQWTRIVDKNKGVVTSEKALVVGTNHGATTVKLENTGQNFQFNLNDRQYQHWDYAFSATVHSAQGKTVDNVLVHIDSQQGEMITQPLFYVAISRARNGAILYVDNPEECVNTIQRYNGYRPTALVGIANPDGNVIALNKSGEWKQQVNIDKFSAGQGIEPVSDNSVNHIRQKLAEKPAKRFWNMQMLQTGVDKHIRELCNEFLGQPNERLSSRTELRYGHKGSLAISMVPGKAGLWRNFETGQSGNIYTLIQQQNGLGFKQAMDYLGDYLQLTPDERLLDSKFNQCVAASHSDVPSEWVILTPSADDLHAMRYPRQLVSESRPIAGTLAERYLREHRGIMADTWPCTLRFHSAIKEPQTGEKLPALLVVATKDQDIHAVQAIYLDPLTANKADIAVPKRTYGRMRFGAVAGDKLLVAEGPETALSIRQAVPEYPVVATLSLANFKHVAPLEKGKELVYCLDNDVNSSCFDKIADAIFLKPPIGESDFNDSLAAHGPDWMREYFSKRLVSNEKFQSDRGCGILEYL